MNDETMLEQEQQAFLLDTLKKLLGQDSPSGFTHKVTALAKDIAQGLGFEAWLTNKGNLVVKVPGREAGRTVGLCAHVDTLGLMVRSVTADGMLMVTKVGGPLMPTLDGEYCRIYTRDGRVYTGTVLSLSPAVHVQDDAATRPRDEKNMAVRIDEKVRSKADVEALGIAAGDYVCYDPKTIVTESGFVKSRFLDDKASSACLLTLLWRMHDTGMRPRFDTLLHPHRPRGGGPRRGHPAGGGRAAGGGHGLHRRGPDLHRVSGVHLRQGLRRPLRLRHGQPSGAAGQGARRGLRGGHLPPLRLRRGRGLARRHGRPRRPHRPRACTPPTAWSAPIWTA